MMPTYREVMKPPPVSLCFAPVRAETSRPSEYSWRNWPLEKKHKVHFPIVPFETYRWHQKLRYLHEPLGVLHVASPHCERTRANVVEDHKIQTSQFLHGEVNHSVRLRVTRHISRYVESLLGSQAEAFLSHLCTQKRGNICTGCKKAIEGHSDRFTVAVSVVDWPAATLSPFLPL